MSTRERADLKQLDPATRLEQRCDVEAMERISQQEHAYNLDKVLAYAFSEPQIKAHSILAKGAAFRSRNHWYRLSYLCKTSQDQMKVLYFKYEIGSEVPRDDWAAHYLVP